jgi:hypothetical protein
MKTKPLAFALLLGASAFAATPLKPDLAQAPAQHGWKFAANHTSASWIADAKGRAALKAKGIVWLEGPAFADGTIEVDILGQSAPPQSNFLGLAFRGVDDTTYDCVYFRPFNFRHANPENAARAVQYISHPEWTWSRLRSERTGRYEKPITPPPDGDAWFRAKIVIAGKTIRVFVNGATTPSLEVESLTTRTSGRIGIWGGAEAGQGGHFANLVLTPAK